MWDTVTQRLRTGGAEERGNQDISVLTSPCVFYSDLTVTPPLSSLSNEGAHAGRDHRPHAAHPRDARHFTVPAPEEVLS